MFPFRPLVIHIYFILVQLSALNQLKNIFGLGNREAEAIVLDVTSKVYRKRLSQAVSGGDLEAADSKAAFLQGICEELHFDPQKASGIHEGNGSCNSCHLKLDSSSQVYFYITNICTSGRKFFCPILVV